MNLNKRNLDVARAASIDGSRYNLNSIHFTKNYTESTNGHILARMSYPIQFNPADVPDVIKTGEKELIQDFIVPAKALKDVKFPKKAKMPVLADLYIDVQGTNGNGSAKFGMTDLETTSTSEVKKIDGTFPETDQVFPKEAPILEIGLSAKYLKLMCEITEGMSARNGIKLTFYGPDSPVKIEARDNDTQQEFTELIMPMKI